MKTFNDNYITFAGDPRGGRPPARLVVRGGDGKITETQMESVSKLYQTFCTANNLSLAQHTTRNYVFGDGMKVRMTSIQGVDEVQVELPVRSAEEIPGLPHGFALLTDWSGPLFYCRGVGETITWRVLPPVPPQLKTPVRSYEQTIRGVPPSSLYSVTLAEEVLWDYEDRSVATAIDSAAGAKFTLPLSLRKPTGLASYTDPPHYARENLILDDEGATLYTAALSAAILVADPEAPVHAPPAQTGDGTLVVVQHFRWAQIAETGNIWAGRFRNEVLARTGDETYTLEDSATENVVMPINVPIPAPAVFDTLGVENIDDKAHIWRAYLGTDGFGWAHTDLWHGFDVVARELINHLSYGGFDLVRTEGAHREELQPPAEPAPTLTVLEVAARAAEYSGTHAVRAEISLDYSVDVYWRGGFKKVAISELGYEFPPSYFGQPTFEMKRVDTNMSVSGTPSVTIDLGWAGEFQALEGTLGGRITGNKYTDIKFTRIAGFAPHYLGLIGPPPYTTILTVPHDWGYTHEGIVAHATSTDTRSITAPWAADYPDPDFLHGQTTTTVTANNTPVNTGEYSLTSRYVIDYDHRGEFYAALKVEVLCSGARWTGSDQGEMTIADLPTYEVTITFESRWGGEAMIQQELYSATHVRPAFEFSTVQKVNVFFSPNTPPSGLETIPVRVPPPFSPPIRVLRQLETITSTQADNLNLACQDFHSAGGEMDSKIGLEWSYGRDRPHRRQPTGVLYARTFTLGDAALADALWLLDTTGCSARENNAEVGDAWFYMPGFAAFLAQKHHIEIRDGAFNVWSNNIPAKDGETRPAPVDRDIKLYRV